MGAHRGHAAPVERRRGGCVCPHWGQPLIPPPRSSSTGAGVQLLPAPYVRPGPADLGVARYRGFGRRFRDISSGLGGDFVCWKQRPGLSRAPFVLFIHFSPGGAGGSRVETAWLLPPRGSGDPPWAARGPGPLPAPEHEAGPARGDRSRYRGGFLFHVGPQHDPVPSRSERPGRSPCVHR